MPATDTHETQSIIVKFAIDSSALTQQQQELLLRHAGAARKAWNWALAHHNTYRDTLTSIVRDASLAEAGTIEEAQALRKDPAWSKPAYKAAREQLAETHPDLHNTVSMVATGKRFRAMTQEQAGDPNSDWGWWVTEDHGVQKVSVNYIFDDLSKALQRYWNNTSPTSKRPRKDGRPAGWPRFKSKKNSPPAFALVGSVTSPVVSAHRVKLPGGIGAVRVHNHTKRLQSLISRGGNTSAKTIRVTRSGGRWYVSFVVEVPLAAVRRPTTAAQRRAGSVGIDQGITRRLALSDGTFIENPKYLDKSAARLLKASRNLARKRRAATRGAPPSARYIAALEKLAKEHRRIRERRAGHLHQVTKQLATSWSRIAIEDLNTKNMTSSARGTLEKPGKNVKQKSGLNRSILDAAFGDFRQKLQYKADWYGSNLVLVPAAYTSQQCNRCGHTASENRETQAVFRCARCGHTANADTNAAENIRDAGARTSSPAIGGRG